VFDQVDNKDQAGNKSPKKEIKEKTRKSKKQITKRREIR